MYNLRWPCTELCPGFCTRDPETYPPYSYDDRDGHSYCGTCNFCGVKVRFTYTLIEKDRRVLHIGHQTVMIERWNETTKEFDVIAEPVRILPLGYGEEYCQYCHTDTYRVTKRDGLLGTEFYSHEFVTRSLGYGRMGWVRESETFEGHRLCVYQDPKYHEWRARKEANKLKMVRDNLETAYRCYCIRMEKRGKPKMSLEDFEFTKKQEKAKKQNRV